MRWQIEICGKLTWTRRDCRLGITSRAIVRDNAVGPFQKNAALKVWSKDRNEKSLDGRLRDDYVAKLRNRTNATSGSSRSAGRPRTGQVLGRQFWRSGSCTRRWKTPRSCALDVP